jgi:hypothetical protein
VQKPDSPSGLPNGKLTSPGLGEHLPNGVHVPPSKADSSTVGSATPGDASPGGPTTPERAPSPAVGLQERLGSGSPGKSGVAATECKDACASSADLANGSLSSVEGAAA